MHSPVVLQVLELLFLADLEGVWKQVHDVLVPVLLGPVCCTEAVLVTDVGVQAYISKFQLG